MPGFCKNPQHRGGGWPRHGSGLLGPIRLPYRGGSLMKMIDVESSPWFTLGIEDPFTLDRCMLKQRVGRGGRHGASDPFSHPKGA